MASTIRRNEKPAGKATHGMSGTPTYKSWLKMKERCHDPNATQWKWYGGNGITVCERWHRFENFYADMGLRPHGRFSIDRIDTNGNYEPGNCRWATHQEQIDNQKKTIWVNLDGEKMTLQSACRKKNFNFSKAYGRHKHGHNTQTVFYEKDMRLKSKEKFEEIKRIATRKLVLTIDDLTAFNEVVIDVAVLANIIRRTAVAGVYFSLIHDPRG